MAIKRRDRDSDGSKNFQMEDDRVPTDHEIFLQAFEKPTQIYRYLRTRNAVSPIFLQRNLSYMRDRTTRNNVKRKNFKVDTLLGIVSKEKYNMPGNYLTLIFLGFHNKAMLEERDVEVKLTISKISHMKRKDSYKSEQDHLGPALVSMNPVDMIGKVPTISVPSENFKSAIPGSSSHSCNLHLEITAYPVINDGRDQCDTQPAIFEHDLVVFDKHNRCILTDGEYEVCVQERHNANMKTFSPKKHSSWDSIPVNYLEELSKTDNPINHFHTKPLLRFRSLWTKEKCGDYVDRPLPITIRKDDHIIANKENKPDQIHNKTNGENGMLSSGGTIRTNGLNNNSFHAHNNNNNNNSNIQNNNNNNNNPEAIVKLRDIASRIIYHFTCNNNSSQQTEAVDNFNCPWCSLHCMTLYSLLKHLKLCHARFNFTYVPMQSGVRVDVSINGQFDGSYSGSPYDPVGPAGSAFSATGPVRRISVTQLLVCHPRRTKPSLNEFLELDENEMNSQRPYITGHTRQYHHTMTCLPILPKELENDSEDENDPAWLQHKTMQMLDEFTDVNEGEKELMKMWNLHIMRKGYVGDIQIPLACEMFMRAHGEEMLRKNLYKNFMLHLCNLFDYGLLSAEKHSNLVEMLQQRLADSIEGRRIMANARLVQIDYWKNVGIHRYREMQLQQQAQGPRKNAQSILAAAAAESNGEPSTMDEDSTLVAKERAAGSHAINGNSKEEKTRKDIRTRLNFNEHKPSGPIVKKMSKADMNVKESLHKRRKSTIPPEEEDMKRGKMAVSTTSKRKSSPPASESPKRRRSLSIAMQSNHAGSIQNVTRRNSLASTTNFLRKAPEDLHCE